MSVLRFGRKCFLELFHLPQSAAHLVAQPNGAGIGAFGRINRDLDVFVGGGASSARGVDADWSELDMVGVRPGDERPPGYVAVRNGNDGLNGAGAGFFHFAVSYEHIGFVAISCIDVWIELDI